MSTPSTDPTPATMPDSDEWGETLVAPHDSPALRRRFRRHTGLVPSIVPYVAPHDWLYRPFLFLSSPTLLAIDAELVSAIGFVVARDNACRFCFGTFWSFLRVAGYSTSALDRLEGALYLDNRKAGDQKALRYAVDVSRGRFAEGMAASDLRAAGYSRIAVREITGAAVLATLVNRASTMLASPLNVSMEEMTSSWYFDLVQPVVQSLLTGWQRLAPSEPTLPAEEVGGPLPSWTGRLRETPMGHFVQSITWRWLETESALDLHVKLLILAVVARGLDCTEMEGDVYRLLQERCDVGQEEARETVDHLRGSAVNARGAVLLDLARASIRYDARTFQRVTRKHTKGLSRDQTIDAVASVGLSNALCRLAVLPRFDA